VRVQFNRNGEEVESVDLQVEDRPMADGSRAVALSASPEAQDQKNAMIRTASRKPTLVLDLDAGANWVTSNTVRVPNAGGTTFDLAPKGAAPVFRAYLSWLISRHHTIRMLFAPLEREGQFVSSTALAFNGLSFLAGRPIDALYKFNSYRLSYIYQFDPIGGLVFRLGFTAKIRDAEIRLTQGAQTTASTDVGFVPLLHLGARYSFLSRWFVDGELEGIAIPGAPGRAFDGAVSVGYRFNPQVSGAIGYRFIEGGADVDQVYNFAFLQTVFARLTLSF
jgi:hypothetical protein